MMTTAVEARLAAYAATLDATAAQRRHALTVDSGNPPAGDVVPPPTHLDRADGRDPASSRRVLVGVGVVLVALVASLVAWRGLDAGHDQSHVSTASSIPRHTASSTSPTSLATDSTLGAPTTVVSPTTPPAATSARTALEPFFVSAAAVDQSLQQASALINAQLSSGHFDSTAATHAIQAADPTALARRIPAGLSIPLETAVLVAWSELDARYAALCDPQASTHLSPGASPCYVNGTRAAQRFPADLAAAEALAARTPPPESVAPSSRAVAEVALQVDAIRESNHGCGATGGYILSSLLPVTWVSGSDSSGPHQGILGRDGTSQGTTEFQATYAPGTGWTTRLNVC